MSLKNRLALVIVALMAAFLATYSALLFGEIGDRADAETAGALTWITALLPDRVDDIGPPGTELIELVSLVRRLDQVRHVRIALHKADGDLLAIAPSRAAELPGWLFAGRGAPTPVRKDVTRDGRVVAYFMVTPAVADEWTELWEDYTRSVALMVGLSVLAVSAIVWSTFRALKPLERVRNALHELQAGARPTRLPSFDTPEVDDIACSFNRMADAVVTAQSERQALMRKLLEGDERTRRLVAHDLHDELSPYLVALQPLTRTLQRQCAERGDVADIADTVHTIASHQTRILSTLRQILTGLHPPELETLGLRGALQQIADWNPGGAEKGPRVVLRMEGDWRSFGDTLDVSIFRMVQECLTNARRHSGGERIDVSLKLLQASPGEDDSVLVEVRNDCAKPLMGPARSGLGTLGIRERCVALGGELVAGPDGPFGWRVRITLPRAAHANTP